MTAAEAVSAVIEERESESVCLLLENRRSTATLTAGIARTSRAMRERIGNVVSCCCKDNSESFSIKIMREGYSPSTTKVDWSFVQVDKGRDRLDRRLPRSAL